MVFNCDCIGSVKTFQKPWGRVGIFDLLLQSRPPLKKKIGGGLPFTIVDVTLYRYATNLELTPYPAHLQRLQSKDFFALAAGFARRRFVR